MRIYLWAADYVVVHISAHRPGCLSVPQSMCIGFFCYIPKKIKEVVPGSGNPVVKLDAAAGLASVYGLVWYNGGRSISRAASACMHQSSRKPRMICFAAKQVARTSCE